MENSLTVSPFSATLFFKYIFKNLSKNVYTIVSLTVLLKHESYLLTFLLLRCIVNGFLDYCYSSHFNQDCLSVARLHSEITVNGNI